MEVMLLWFKLQLRLFPVALWYYGTIASDDGSKWNGRPAIISANDSLVDWLIYGSLGLDVLTRMPWHL